MPPPSRAGNPPPDIDFFAGVVKLQIPDNAFVNPVQSKDWFWFSRFDVKKSPGFFEVDFSWEAFGFAEASESVHFQCGECDGIALDEHSEPVEWYDARKPPEIPFASNPVSSPSRDKREAIVWEHSPSRHKNGWGYGRLHGVHGCRVELNLQWLQVELVNSCRCMEDAGASQAVEQVRAGLCIQAKCLNVKLRILH